MNAFIIEWQRTNGELYNEIRRFAEVNEMGQYSYREFYEGEDDEDFPLIAEYIKENNTLGYPTLINIWW